VAEKTHSQLVPTQFKPGQSGNPKGWSILPAEVRAARKENMYALIKLVQQYTSLTTEQAAKRLNGPEPLQLEEMIQGVINKAKEGDAKAFQAIMEIMCGKIPEGDHDQFSDEDIQTLTYIKMVRAKNALNGGGSAPGG
jgi:hypothetical protein